MIRLIWLVLFFSVTCLGNGMLKAQQLSKHEISDRFTKTHLKLIKKQLKELPGGTELSILMIDDSLCSYLGVRKGEQELIYLSNHEKAFEIGSITKVFTSTLLTHFISVDSIEENDPINPYFNFQFNDARDISFLSLSNHTSGLPRMPSNLQPVNPLDPYQTYTNDDLHAYLRLELPKNDSIGKYEYSNIGAALLGHSLSKVSGKTYLEMLNSVILKPLKMSNTVIDRIALKVDLVKGQDVNGDPFEG